jgi:hypothetical protein
MKGINFNTILLLIIVGFAVWTIRGCVTKSSKPEQMIRNEIELEHLKSDKLKDSINQIILLAAKDSVIESIRDQLASTTPKLQQSKKDYEKIRPVINNLSDNELLQRANSFKPD